MRIVVVGATGNCGTALVRELSGAGHEVLGVARRTPEHVPDQASVEWRAADVAEDDLAGIVDGADAVVHLAWMFQPTHEPEVTWRANAVGTRRVLDAVASRGVPAVVVASSLAAYSPARSDEPVDESYPTNGPSPAAYAREKAYVERALDAFELANPGVRTVRVRPAFVFQRSAGTEQRRIFGGPLVRPFMLDRRLIPVVPIPSGLRFQAVHAADLARAYRAMVERPVAGAYNIAAGDVIRREQLGELLHARTLEVPPAAVKAALESSWRLHLLRAPGDLFDALMRVPLMSTQRARTDLGWQPRHTGLEALSEMIEGARHRWGSAMPPLDPDAEP